MQHYAHAHVSKCMPELWLTPEHAWLGRYKNRNPHRSAIYFRRLIEVSRLLPSVLPAPDAAPPRFGAVSATRTAQRLPACPLGNVRRAVAAAY